jgi:hypothetical protein
MWHVWWNRRGAHRVLMGRPVERNKLEFLGLDWSIILKRIFKKWDGAMNWNVLGQDRHMRRALVIAVMNLRVP